MHITHRCSQPSLQAWVLLAGVLLGCVVAHSAGAVPPMVPTAPVLPAAQEAATSPLPQPSAPPLKMINAEIKADEAFQKALPPTLRRPDIVRAYRLRRTVELPGHAPIHGPINAPITLIEFNDLSCLQCREISQQVDEIMARHKNSVRLVYLHLPFDPKETNQVAAFYAKLAQQEGVFWPFREKIKNLTEFTPDTLGQILLEVGVEPRNLRDNFFTNAATYYQQLDADSAIAKELGVTLPPALFINGKHIGKDVQIGDIDAIIDFERGASGQAAITRYQAVMQDAR